MEIAAKLENVDWIEAHRIVSMQRDQMALALARCQAELTYAVEHIRKIEAAVKIAKAMSENGHELVREPTLPIDTPPVISRHNGARAG